MKSQYILIILLAFASCKEADLPTPESENIIGEWELAYVDRSRGIIEYPESDDDIFRYIFTSKGKYEYYKGDECRGNAKFFIIGEPSENGSYDVELRKQRPEQHSLRFISKDTIEFNLTGSRNWSNYFVRTK